MPKVKETRKGIFKKQCDECILLKGRITYLTVAIRESDGSTRLAVHASDLSNVVKGYMKDYDENLGYRGNTNSRILDWMVI